MEIWGELEIRARQSLEILTPIFRGPEISWARAGFDPSECQTTGIHKAFLKNVLYLSGREMNKLAWHLQIGIGMSSRCSKTGFMEAGNEAAPENIATHREYLFYYALARLRDRDKAEDAVQETFLAALAAERTFSGNSTRRTWLTGILNHKVCDLQRRNFRDLSFFQSLPLNNGPERDPVTLASMRRHSSDPRTELEHKELREALIEALKKLPARMALVYQLYESEGWSSREICKVLRISQHNLWIILHRARKRLRVSLSSWRSTDRPKSMLKITKIESSAGEVILHLEGRLIGAWVNVLKSYCSTVREKGQPLTLEMREVSFADRTGISLLCALEKSGVVLAGCSPLIAEELHWRSPRTSDRNES
jgi:RNA polymerase sigma-70 factor, ECF subfamily